MEHSIDVPNAPGLFERLIRLVFPAKCMICGEILNEDSKLYLCENCYRLLPRCGRGIFKTPNIPYIDGLFAAFYYENGIDEAIKTMKFRSHPRLSATMSFLIAEELMKESELPDIDIIVPVPMHPSKKRRRGYNQTELLAKELSRLLKIPMDGNILGKIRDTRPQSLLKREERMHNMDDVFILSNKDAVRSKNVLLVDDVTTTGTTINQCAKILYNNCSGRIYAAVIAIAQK